MSGRLIVVEGPEGSGKSTLARALAARLDRAGYPPVVVREPGGTPVAEALRAAVLAPGPAWPAERELLYICTARADLVARVIRPALAEGRVVLSDRFDLSTRAYQGVGRGVPEPMLEWVNHAATGGLQPDLTLIVDLPPGVGLARQVEAGKQRDRLDLESEAFHERIAAFYRGVTGDGVVHVDGTLAPEALEHAAWRAVAAALSRPPAAVAPG